MVSTYSQTTPEGGTRGAPSTSLRDREEGRAVVVERSRDHHLGGEKGRGRVGQEFT